VIKKNGYTCYVVGNRKVKGVVLPTDIAVKNFFENFGFEHINTFVRSIPNKRMPSKNSPTNVTGVLDSTMTQEYIVVMKRNSLSTIKEQKSIYKSKTVKIKTKKSSSK
jgi:site-specific DNA-methyltransferase (cytosine-N4-specific)